MQGLDRIGAFRQKFLTHDTSPGSRCVSDSDGLSLIEPHKKRTCVWAGTQRPHNTARAVPARETGRHRAVRGQTGDTAPATPTGAHAGRPTADA